jgi:hypothetical protein
MVPDPYRPESDVAIHVVATFGDSAIRAALLDGQRPDRSLSTWLSPEHPAWTTAVRLLPEVAESTDHELVVAPSYEVVLNHLTPVPWELPGLPNELIMPRWPCPELRVIRDSAPRPVDRWPKDVDGLLEIAIETEAKVHAAAESRLDELTEATNTWLGGMTDRFDRWAAILESWSGDELICDPVWGGSADGEVAALKRALDHLADLIDNFGAFDLGVELPPVVSSFWAAPWAFVDADAAVHRALQAARPKVREGYRKRQEAEVRGRERQEATSWAIGYGSNRLKMAVKANVLDTAMGIYRDERLAKERPGWMWVTQADDSKLQKKAVNPSEKALAALLEAQKRDHTAYLGYHEKTRSQVLVGTLMNRSIWTPTHDDWPGEDWLEGCISRTVSVESVLSPPSDDEEPF